jgi:hypothetical protein
MSGFCPGCGEEVRYSVVFCEYCGAPVSPSIVETAVAGPFTGWTGDTTFTFTNGERWHQAAPGAVTCQLENPRAWIYPEGTGHALRVDGIAETVSIEPVPDEVATTGEERPSA